MSNYRPLTLLAFLLATLCTNAQDVIHICSDRICTGIETKRIKIACIKSIKANEPLSLLYERNKKTIQNHEISKDHFLNAIQDTFRLQHPGDYRSRAAKAIIKSIIKDSSRYYKDRDMLLSFLQLKSGFVNKDSLQYQIEKLEAYKAAAFMKDGMDEYLVDRQKNRTNADFIYGLRSNQRILQDHISYLIDKDYLHYSHRNARQKWIKGFTFYHDNDVLLPGINEDKFYTGGLRMEVYTDKLRLNFLHALIAPNKNILTYQSIFLGGEAFTPFIRDTNEMVLFDRHKNDRPFASYEYIGMAHYRMHSDCHQRSSIQFRVGKIGSTRSDEIQSALHRDQVIKSIKVKGWENQIANGGRYAFNIDYRREWMLRRKTKNLTDKKEAPLLKGQSYYPPRFSIFTELHVGQFLTAIDLGMNISRLGFRELGGTHYNLHLDIGETQKLQLYATPSLRYIIHNSSLEGFGLFKTPKDDPTEELPKGKNQYRLQKKEVHRLVGYLEAGITYRRKSVTIFYKAAFHTKEFKKKYAEPYGWGTLGLTFIGS